MSIQLNWEALTSGSDGDALAERIRAFIHDKFQTVPLPRFIKSVTVHDFDFGSVPPELELKDISDPLPDFYEPNDDDDDDEDDDDEDDDDDESGEESSTEPHQDEEPHINYHRHHHHSHRQRHKHDQNPTNHHASKPRGRARPSHNRSASQKHLKNYHHDMASPFMGTSTPGLLGGPGRSYLHGHLRTGTQTPLATVAGAHLGNSWLGNGFDSASASAAVAAAAAATASNTARRTRGGVIPPLTSSHNRNHSQSSISVDYFSPTFTSSPSLPSPTSYRDLREKSSVSTLAPTSVGTSRPPTRDSPADNMSSAFLDSPDYDDGADTTTTTTTTATTTTTTTTTEASSVPGDPSTTTTAAAAASNQLPPRRRRREPRVEDVQAVFRIRYTGDIRLNLTAEILLDYPMPSFVGIPLKLNITGLSFDGVGVLAHIRKRVHFCFLSPEDAVAAVGQGEHDGDGDGGDGPGAGAGPSQSSNNNKNNNNNNNNNTLPQSSQKSTLGGSTRFGGLLQEIKVESEIGGREGGKQSLKNVGKVEKFVLEQVRRIFDEEFVYPSFWTFLV